MTILHITFNVFIVDLKTAQKKRAILDDHTPQPGSPKKTAPAAAGKQRTARGRGAGGGRGGRGGRGGARGGARPPRNNFPNLGLIHQGEIPPVGLASLSASQLDDENVEDDDDFLDRSTNSGGD
jgi:hypothetical protein